jgi:hypothetical protein
VPKHRALREHARKAARTRRELVVHTLGPRAGRAQGRAPKARWAELEAAPGPSRREHGTPGGARTLRRAGERAGPCTTAGRHGRGGAEAGRGTGRGRGRGRAGLASAPQGATGAARPRTPKARRTGPASRGWAGGERARAGRGSPRRHGRPRRGEGRGSATRVRGAERAKRGETGPRRDAARREIGSNLFLIDFGG